MENASEVIEQGYGKDLRRCPHCITAWLHDRIPRAWWVKTFFFFLPFKRFEPLFDVGGITDIDFIVLLRKEDVNGEHGRRGLRY
nr:hypothetical protein [Parapedobacter tibetensis]